MKVTLDGKTVRDVPFSLEVQRTGTTLVVLVKKAKEYKYKRDKIIQMDDLGEARFTLAEFKKLEKLIKDEKEKT